MLEGISVTKNIRYKNIKKYTKKDFDYIKYVKNFFVEDGIAYISCSVTNKDDIISHYSVRDYEWLNNDFAKYIEDNAYYIPVDYPITIELCGGCFDENDKTLITNVIKDYFGLKLGDEQLNLNINTKKAVFLFISSLIIFLVSYIFMKFNVINNLYEWILILFWFLAWEFFDVLILERTHLKHKKIDAIQLANVNVIFSDIVSK